MKKQSVLKSISLENFYTIKERHVIPLDKKITFLYGPNSAGKSSVRKAYEILKYIFNGKDTFEIKGENDFLWTAWRDVTGDEESRLGVVFSVNNSFFDVFNTDEQSWLRASSRAEAVDVGIEFVLNNPHPVIDEVIFSINNQPLIHKDCFILSINVDHQFLADKFPVDDFLSIAYGTSGRDKNLNGVRWISIAYDGSSTKGWEMYDDFSVDDDLEEFPEHQDRELTEKFIDFCNFVIRRIRYAIDYDWDLLHVPGSRRVPAKDDLRYSLDCSIVSITSNKDKSGDPYYEPIAADYAREWVIDRYAKKLGAAFYETRDYEYLAKNRLSKISVANRLLDEYLHIEAAYQLDAQIKIILTPEALDDLVDPVVDNESWYFPRSEINVELCLRDSKNRRLSFDNVGSGIGYALPIIAALTTQCRILFIEQPELHLHPALQATLMDAAIEQVNMSGPQGVVVESHSEIALLRALRRVREFENRTYINKTLGLGADDVMILYFEPSTSGATKIKNIRVSTDGDLLDRWPGGFFNERDKDIF